MIENQWTYQIGQIEKYNNHVWQVGFYEKDGMIFVGVFDHLLKDDQHTIGLDEGVEFSDEIKELIMLETVNVLIGQDHFIYGYILLEQTDFWLRRPEPVSLMSWFIRSRKKKFGLVVKKQTRDDGIDFLAPPDSQWFITVKFGKRIDLFNKYFARLGRNPDHKPDILYVSSENIDLQLENCTQKDFLKQMPFKSFSGLSAFEWDKWKKLTSTFYGILWATDGHVYFATKHKNKEDILRQLEIVAKRYHLEVAHNHMLC